MPIDQPNQLPRLPGRALKVPVSGGFLPIIESLPTHVKVQLGCDSTNNQGKCSNLMSFIVLSRYSNTNYLLFLKYGFQMAK